MPRMSQRPRTTSTSLRERPWLLAAVAAAGVATALAVTLISTNGEVDVLSVVFYGLAPLLFTAVGAIILAQRPGHGVGRVSLLIGLALTLSASVSLAITLVDPPGSVTVILPGIAGSILEFAVALADTLPSIALFIGGAILVVWFPDGRPSSRLGLLATSLVGLAILSTVVVGLQDVVQRSIGYQPALGAFFEGAIGAVFGALSAAYVIAMVDLTLRYRRSDAVARTQIRWVLAAVAVELVLTVLAFTLSARFDFLWPAWIASTILPIIAIAIAITRYHLYDIDRIISRTIAYSVISVALIAIFVVAVVALQAVLSPLTNGDTIAVAASTLAVAALFQPLRSRVQDAVDRRFHRARYDAERTVERFAGRLRDELDLPTLVTDLRGVAVDAVEPRTTGVWLRAGGVGS
jgi:hypothetical protein